MLGWGLTGKASAEHGSALLEAKPTPSQPPPWLRQRGGAKARPRRRTQRSRLAPSLSRSEGEGWGGVAFDPVEPSHARLGPCRESVCRAWLGTTQNQPPPNLPLATPKGRGKAWLRYRTRRSCVAPSLSRSEGEGWGGVAFDRVEPSHARLGPYRESVCRAWLGTTRSKTNPLPTSPLLTPQGRGKANHSTSFGSAFQYPVARIQSFGTCRCPSTNLRIIRARLDSVAIQ